VWRKAIDELYVDGKAAALTNRHYAGTQPLDEREWELLRKLYEGELLYTDQITKAILQTVDATSDPEETLVFLLSDHGENLGDHGHLSHIFNVYDSNLKIACLARGPGFEAGATERRLVQIVDVYPTVLRAAGLEPEPQCAGLDLCGELPDARLLSASLDYPTITLRTFPKEMRESGVLAPFERELQAAVSRRYKIIRGSDGREEIYDLVADPREEHPLDAGQVDEAAVKGLAAFLALSRTPADSPTPADGSLPTDPETIEALRSLGYVE
jgi:arylsulfatase A-like enzyme